MNQINKVEKKLKKIRLQIQQENFINKEMYGKEPLFRGADIQVARDQHTLSKKPDFYPEDKYIITKHADEVSILIYAIRDVYESYFNYINKYHYYDQLADAAIKHISEDNVNKNCKDLLLCIIDRAIKFLPEVESEYARLQ